MARHHARQLRDEARVVHACQLVGAGRPRRERHRARAKAVLIEGLRHRAQAFRALGVAGRRFVFKKNLIEAERGFQGQCILGSLTSVRKATALTLVATVAAFVLYALAQPALPNGDGIGYLRATQLADGSWHEDQFTGTGFPKVFYLKYHMYALYFPLMALARYESLSGPRVQALHSNRRITAGSR